MVLPLRRTGADVVAYFAAFDSTVARSVSTASSRERAMLVQALDAALSTPDRTSFDRCVAELRRRYETAPAGSDERRALPAILRILQFERERLFSEPAVARSG